MQKKKIDKFNIDLREKFMSKLPQTKNSKRQTLR